MNEEMDMRYIDQFILDAIQKQGAFNDHELARTLHCPRTFLLDRLADMISKGLVVEKTEKYALSEQGKFQWIPLDRCSTEQVSCSCGAEEETFDWTLPYIPARDWKND